MPEELGSQAQIIEGYCHTGTVSTVKAGRPVPLRHRVDVGIVDHDRKLAPVGDVGEGHQTFLAPNVDWEAVQLDGLKQAVGGAALACRIDT
jgi:hypothetical protein